MNQERIGQFIKELREKNKITQTDLAEKLHIGREAVSKWERGVNYPSSIYLKQLSEIFNISIEELLYGEEKTEANENDIQEIPMVIIDEHNKAVEKQKKEHKKSLILLIFLIIITLLFLSYYFVNTYKTTKIYTLNSYNDDFSVSNGVFLVTREKLYMKLGEVTSNKNETITILKLYYVDENNSERLIEEKDGITINLYDSYGYGTNFEYDKLDYILNNMYLRATFENGKISTLKLEFTQDFINDFIFPKKTLSAFKDYKKLKGISYNEELENRAKKNLNFETDGTYSLIKGNYHYIYFEDAKELVLNYKTDETYETWSYSLHNVEYKLSYASYDNTKIKPTNSFEYDENIQKFNCISNEPCSFDKDRAKIFFDKFSFILKG